MKVVNLRQCGLMSILRLFNDDFQTFHSTRLLKFDLAQLSLQKTLSKFAINKYLDQIVIQYIHFN